MFEVDVNGLTQQYRTKPTMNVDITGSSGSIPKPLTYDYMPEGYPKKDGWSVEWDGNTEGKIAAVGAPIYKFSDMVLTYEEFLSAMVVRYQDGGSYSIMVSETYPEQIQSTDAISSFICSSGEVQVLVVGEDNAEASGIIFPTKGLYTRGDSEPFKLIKENITPMSADFLPKNLNVIFISESGTDVPTSCNVIYDDLRGWVTNRVPVLAVFIYTAGSQYIIHNITKIALLADELVFVYYNDAGKSRTFAYNSDGTFSGGATS